MGSLLQASAYGATIPVVYGQTQSNLLAIWAANLRQGGGGMKKFKQLKKGITNYCECIDFLLGHNPIRGVLQVMNNGSNAPLAFDEQSFCGIRRAAVLYGDGSELLFRDRCHVHGEL